MAKLINEYIENGFRIKEYDNGTIIKSAVSSIQTPSPEPQITLEEQVAQLKADNLILMDALATVFEELLNTQAMIGGTA